MHSNKQNPVEVIGAEMCIRDSLKKVLINKLLKLTENYTSEGVKDYMGADIISKGARFSASDFSDCLLYTSEFPVNN